MKIIQDLIVFDLEATSSQSVNGHQENNNIIQIGAVFLKKKENLFVKLRNKNFKLSVDNLVILERVFLAGITILSYFYDKIPKWTVKKLRLSAR